MLIECSRCKTRAKIPDSKEGAKVRCPECSHTYVARPVGSQGAKAASGPSPMQLSLGIGGLVVVAFLFWVSNQSKPSAAPAVEKEVVDTTPAVKIDIDGWDSETVKHVRDVYRAAYVMDKSKLKRLVALDELWAWNQNQITRVSLGEGEEIPADELADPADYRNLEGTDRYVIEEEVLVSMLQGDHPDLPSKWNPVSGKAIEITDTTALVRVQVDLREPGETFETRQVDWHLARTPKGWMATHYERYISPEEQRAKGAKRAKAYESKVLSDGSQVIEAEPGPLDYDPSTPAEVRQKIEGLYAKIIDLSLAREGITARNELVQVGIPALPRLLTGLYEIPLDTQEHAMQLNMVVLTLRDITGEAFGFKPIAEFGVAGGTSEERRQSAIKQWFGWWYRRGYKFEGRVEGSDGLEEYIELTDKERAKLIRDGDLNEDGSVPK